MRFGKIITLIIFILIISSNSFAQDDSVTIIRCGFFEAGLHPVNSILRDEFQRQLEALSPDDKEFIFVPYGYGDGGWRKDSCKVLARRLAATPNIDLMITVGPWVVEDLLNAGYKGNILAMRQLDPKALGVLGPNNYPLIENLTVHVKPDKFEKDLNILRSLFPVKKLGVIFFPSNKAEQDSVMAKINAAGQNLGMEIVFSEGYDNFGTFAYFNAWNKLDKEIDALYIGPLWGMDAPKINAFLDRVKNEGIPLFTYEGKYLVDRGAFATNSTYSVVSEARYNAIKAIKIADGAKPNILPVDFIGGSSITINEATMQKCNLNINMNILRGVDFLPAPIPEDASYLTLKDAIARAINANPNYLATYDILEQAIQSAKSAMADYLPNIDINAYAGYVDDNTIYNTNEPIDNSQFNASLSLRQTIFSMESIKTIKIAGKKKQLEKSNQQQARLDLEMAVTLAYLNYLRANELHALQERYHQISERNIEISGTRYFLEDEQRYSDFLRWQSERQSTKQRSLTAKTEADIARVMLNVLLNFPADNQLVIDTSIMMNEALVIDISNFSHLISSNETVSNFNEYLVSLSKKSHPVYNSFYINRDIQNMMLSKTSFRLFPTIDFKASYNMHNRLRYSQDFSEKHNSWSVYGLLNFPIFEGTKRSHEKSRIKAYISELEFKQDAFGLEQMGNIYKRTSRIFNLTQIIPGLMHSISLDHQTLDLVSMDYESDRVGLTELLDVIDHAHKSEVTAINNRFQFVLESARLVNDLGFSSTEGSGTFQNILRSKIEEFIGK